MNTFPHQYIDRETGDVKTEILCADPWISRIYSDVREKAHWLFNALNSRRFTNVLAWLHYDIRRNLSRNEINHIFTSLGIDSNEPADNKTDFRCLRDIFERKIRYEIFRPMPDSIEAIVSPADSRILIGSFSNTSTVYIKDKLFDYTELIGKNQPVWLSRFRNGDFAVFRLTPDRYHYNHMPVTGVVVEHYEITGQYHSCNPTAMVHAVTPVSKNRRILTVLNTDTDGGTGIGYVAMIEVVAMMIGDIVQCYSETAYDVPQGIIPGMMLKRGCPKSLFRPGSSTTVLIFEKNRMKFSDDLWRNLFRNDVSSRFTQGFGQPLVETDVRVRSEIGRRVP
jgi:phosphatidylserine decarboxylase